MSDSWFKQIKHITPGKIFSCDYVENVVFLLCIKLDTGNINASRVLIELEYSPAETFSAIDTSMFCHRDVAQKLQIQSFFNIKKNKTRNKRLVVYFNFF